MTTTRRTKRTYNRRPPQPKPETVEIAPRPTLEETVETAYRAAQAAEPPPAPSVERPAMRAPMRDDSRARAAARAAEIFGTVDLDSEEDKFALPPGLAPEDWEYEWKTHEVIGKRNPGYEVDLARKGWEAVQTSRHPEMMPGGYSGPITREGMVLMERPKVVNDRQKRAAYERAVGQVRGQEVQVGVAPKDTMQRTDSSGRNVSKISREFVSPGALKNEGFVPVSGPE